MLGVPVLCSVSLPLTQVNYYQLQLIVSMSEQRSINGALTEANAVTLSIPTLDWKLSMCVCAR